MEILRDNSPSCKPAPKRAALLIADRRVTGQAVAFNLSNTHQLAGLSNPRPAESIEPQPRDDLPVPVTLFVVEQAVGGGECWVGRWFHCTKLSQHEIGQRGGIEIRIKVAFTLKDMEGGDWHPDTHFSTQLMLLFVRDQSRELIEIGSDTMWRRLQSTLILPGDDVGVWVTPVVEQGQAVHLATDDQAGRVWSLEQQIAQEGARRR